jgi:DNA repair photolyase
MLRIIYAPRGKALEYARLAVSLYKGCSHGCTYCFAPDSTKTKKENFCKPYPRQDAIKKLEKDCKDLQDSGDQSEILMSFTTDPYQPLDDEFHLTRKAIELFQAFGLHFTILTKGGIRSMRDFDLLETTPDLCRYGTTLTCCFPDTEKNWEPNAAPWNERVEALRQAHKRGIKTWVSIEPIISPAQSMYLIGETINFVDQYRIGLMNHVDLYIPDVKLYDFTRRIKFLSGCYKNEFIFKKGMDKYFTIPKSLNPEEKEVQP